MKRKKFIFDSKQELGEALAENFIRDLKVLLRKQEIVTIALSGGNTPEVFYQSVSKLSAEKRRSVDWNRVHFFWGDERCVPPNNEQSNYRNAYKSFIRQLFLPKANIHRIFGEENPYKECLRYASEIKSVVPMVNRYPRFDWIFLGLGEDGHIASIFPHQIDLLFENEICSVATHPETGENRITLTGKVIINANRISFLAAGSNKKDRIKEIFNKEPEAKNLPAFYIKSVGGLLEWYLDKEAAEDII